MDDSQRKTLSLTERQLNFVIAGLLWELKANEEVLSGCTRGVWAEHYINNIGDIEKIIDLAKNASNG
jgi:hypothetical protein